MLTIYPFQATPRRKTNPPLVKSQEERSRENWDRKMAEREEMEKREKEKERERKETQKRDKEKKEGETGKREDWPEGLAGRTGEMAAMSWQIALSNPGMTRLGDWLAKEHGEDLAWVEGYGGDRWDLERWETKEACRHLNIVFVKDPEGQVWPFVQEEQTGGQVIVPNAEMYLGVQEEGHTEKRGKENKKGTEKRIKNENKTEKTVGGKEKDTEKREMKLKENMVKSEMKQEKSKSEQFHKTMEKTREKMGFKIETRSVVQGGLKGVQDVIEKKNLFPVPDESSLLQGGQVTGLEWRNSNDSLTWHCLPKAKGEKAKGESNREVEIVPNPFDPSNLPEVMKETGAVKSSISNKVAKSYIPLTNKLFSTKKKKTRKWQRKKSNVLGKDNGDGEEKKNYEGDDPKKPHKRGPRKGMRRWRKSYRCNSDSVWEIYAKHWEELKVPEESSPNAKGVSSKRSSESENNQRIPKHPMPPNSESMCKRRKKSKMVIKGCMETDGNNISKEPCNKPVSKKEIGKPWLEKSPERKYGGGGRPGQSILKSPEERGQPPAPARGTLPAPVPALPQGSRPAPLCPVGPNPSRGLPPAPLRSQPPAAPPIIPPHKSDVFDDGCQVCLAPAGSGHIGVCLLELGLEVGDCETGQSGPALAQPATSTLTISMAQQRPLCGTQDGLHPENCNVPLKPAFQEKVADGSPIFKRNQRNRRPREKVSCSLATATEKESGLEVGPAPSRQERVLEETLPVGGSDDKLSAQAKSSHGLEDQVQAEVHEAAKGMESAPGSAKVGVLVSNTVPHDELAWDGRTSFIQGGLMFRTRTDVKSFMQLYQNRMKKAFTIESGGCSPTSSSRQIVFSCKYGKKRKSESTGQRKLQHTVKQGCEACVRFYCPTPQLPGGPAARLKSWTETHNHLSTDAMYEQDTNKIEVEEENVVRELASANIKVGCIKNVFEKKFSKKVTTKHIRYKLLKMLGPKKEKEQLAEFLQKVEDEGGVVTPMLDQKENIRALAVMTSEMRSAYIGANPDVVCIDTTFNFETSGYKLTAFLYLNPVTGKGEVGQLAFIADEGAEVLKFVFGHFRQLTKRDPAALMVDKDFTEIRVLQAVFGKSRILLCGFHVPKWFKGIIATTGIPRERKEELMDSFRQCLYAPTSELFETSQTSFLGVADGVDVRVGSGDAARYEPLVDYYMRCWGNITELWTYHARKNLPGLGDENTNNRLERLWRSMKDHLKMLSGSEMTIYRAVEYLVRFAEEQIQDRYTWSRRHAIRLWHPDPEVRKIFDEAAGQLNDSGCLQLRKSLKELHAKEDKMVIVDGVGVKETFKKKSVKETGEEADKEPGEEAAEGRGETSKLYQTTESDCSCSGSIRSGAPCRHVLLVRKRLKQPLFETSTFAARYRIERKYDLEKEADAEVLIDEEGAKHPDEVSSDEEDIRTYTKSRRDRYNLVKPYMERITELLIRHSGGRLEEYVADLVQVEQNIREGVSLFQNNSAHIANSEEKALEKEQEETEEQANGSRKYSLTFKRKTVQRGRPKGGSKLNFKLRGRKRKSGKQAKDGSHKKFKPRPEDTPIVCVFPADATRPKAHSIHVQDYLSLAQYSSVWDVIIDFQYRFLQPEGPAGQAVWLLETMPTQSLHSWWTLPRLENMVEQAKLWRPGGCRLLVAAACEKGHFFCLAAVCAPQPVLYVMESIGGYEEPAVAEVVRDFINQQRQLAGGVLVPIITKIMLMPRQAQGSNDCGLFMLETTQRILANPDEFIARAEAGNLAAWYSPEVVGGRREELAARLRDLGEEQRAEGGVLEGLPPLALPDLGFRQVGILYCRWQLNCPITQARRCEVGTVNISEDDPVCGGVSVQAVEEFMKKSLKKGKKRKSNNRDGEPETKRKKCGLCHQPGHYRRKCPFKQGLGEEGHIKPGKKDIKKKTKPREVEDFIGNQSLISASQPPSQSSESHVKRKCQGCGGDVLISDHIDCDMIMCSERMHRSCFQESNFTCHPIGDDGFLI